MISNPIVNIIYLLYLTIKNILCIICKDSHLFDFKSNCQYYFNLLYHTIPTTKQIYNFLQDIIGHQTIFNENIAIFWLNSTFNMPLRFLASASRNAY